jgi:hypothetical protein
VEEQQPETPEDILNKMMQAKRYDIKQIKEEVWKVLEVVIP